MKKPHLLKSTLCLLMALMCHVAWAQDFVTPVAGKHYKIKGTHSTNPWLTATVENGGIDVAANEADAAVYLKTANGLQAVATGKYIGTGGNGSQISLVDAEAEVTIEAADNGRVYIKTGGRYLYNNQPDYTREAGNLTAASTDAPKWGFIEVQTEVVTVEYTILINGNQTIKIGNETYNNGDTYTAEGAVEKNDITVVAPEGQFAAVSVDHEGKTINVYFATLPTQPDTEPYTNAVLYPAQQTAVGEAKAEEQDGVYTLYNKVLAASYIHAGNAIYFGGSEAMDLEPGTELFTVAFGAGDNVPASAMTLTDVKLEDLTGNANAIGGAEHYDGKALVANYTYTYKDNTLNIEWRAVLRDGSHYLRTEMILTGNDVDMFNVIPLIYNVDTKAAGSTPQTIGNTRGAVLMSNKIFAGLETPTAYNTVGGATGEEDNWNLTKSYDAVSLAPNAWELVPEAEVPARVIETTGLGYPHIFAYKQTNIELKKDQKVEVKVEYKSGYNQLNFGGVDLIDANGQIAANDYHKGSTGNKHDRNTFTMVAPYDGTFTVRVIIDNSQAIDATSALTTKVYTAKEGVVINSDIVGIQGRWSRNTTLQKGDNWKVAAVVGLIAQDGTEDDANIHNTQKRRSFLAYSERERAVPWRAVPVYISWYELNINRNNAAPGQEHTNFVADQVLDVLDHWKGDFYDRYGVAPKMFVIDDGWDTYGEWQFHSGFPNEMRDIAAAAKEMDGAGVGAWLGPVGGYGQSGNYRRQYWNGKGGMQLSNPDYYAAFKKAAENLVCNQDGVTGYQQGSDNYTFFKFDGISGQYSATGPDAGDTGNENAEGIIRLERFVREELREDIFFNTTVGTWASPFWYQISDATWRQEDDHSRTGDNNVNRENWITYRDRLVYQNYVQNSPICPINTLMTHGFILSKFGAGPKADSREYLHVRNELRCAFLCGSGMVELYNDYDLMNSINDGALWADLAECIAWQERNADVLPDAHWVGGNPWTGGDNPVAEVYGWAAWNGTKSTLALRNGANDAQQFTFTLRSALNIPANVQGSIILRSAFGDQEALTGLTEGQAYNIDANITVTLPGSSVYAFEGISSTAATTNVSSIALTTENNIAEIRTDETLVVKASVNADATFPALAWSSSNPEVATVTGGLVNPLQEGEVTITATAKDGSGKTASVTLKVKAVPTEPPFSTEKAPEYWWIQFCNGNAALAGSTSDTDAQAITATKAYDNKQLWQLVGNASEFYLKNKAGKYLSWNGSRFATTTVAGERASLILHKSTNSHAAEAGCYEIQLKGNSYMNQHGGAGTGKQLGTWNAGDANNHFVLVSAAPAYPEFDNEEAWYYIQFGNGGWVIEDKGANTNVQTAKLDDLTTQKWRVTGTKDNCQFINQEGHYLVYKNNRIQASTSQDAQGFKLVATDNTNYAPRIEIQHNSTTDKAFNMNGGAGSGKEVALYNANDGGNPLAFVPVESVTFPEFRIAASAAAAPAEKLTLWYTQPATATGVANTWMEYSLPIGNGQFGASLFGGVAKDEILFNDKTLWSGGPNQYGYYLPFGSVYIEDISGTFTYNPNKPVQNYYRDLNLKTATGTVSYEDAEGVKYTRQYIASNPDKAVVTKISASEAGKLSLRITMESGKPTVAAETTYEDGYAQFTGKLQTVSYNATLKVVAENGTMTTGADGIVVEGADEVLIVLMGCTDFVGNDASHVNGRANQLPADNKAIVDAVAEKGWDAVYAAHVADHQEYFNRVSFDLDGVENNLPTNELITEYNAASGTRNLMLEQLYYHYGRYLSIASSRGVDLPNNLQGIWNNTCTPPWHSDIHANINVQMNYWPVSAGNLNEMYLPFLNQIINEAAQPEWRALASKAVNELNSALGTNTAVREDSWTLLTENNIFGGISGFAPNYVIANAWYVTHLWQHYRYTLDEEYLLRAFPAMKGASLFWADRMVLAEDGTYECPNEYSPEHGPGSENAVAHAQQIAWESIDNTIKAANALNAVNKGLISQTDYDLLVDRLAKMDRGLAIEEYEANGNWPAERNGIKAGDKIIREWKYSRFYASGDQGHRHMSHLMALYPFGQLTPADGELFEAAINSMKLRGDESTGWSMGWKINLWARALMGDRSHAILRKALKHSTSYGTNAGAGGIYYNLYDSHAPFQIDGNFGATSGIQEMLMQSHTEVIDILPALPAEWSKGSVKGLKAVGDFTVDIEWEGNQARKVVITNNQGQPCYVKCTGLSAAEITVDGAAYALGEETEHGGLPCYSIASEAGDKIVIDLSNAIQNDKSALTSLIAQTKALVNDCYDHYTEEVEDLQTTDNSGAYYVWTNAQSKSEGPIANLVDGNNDNFFHSAYGSETITDGLNHHITVNLGEENAISSFKFKYTTRKGAGANFPAEIKVWGGVQGAEEVEYELLATLNSGLPQAGGQAYTSPVVEGNKEYTHLRFMVNRFFHMAEFDLMPRTAEAVNAYPDAVHVPAAVEAAKSGITAAEAAVEATQTAKEYAASLAALQATYDKLAAAIESGSLPVLLSLDADKPYVYKIGIKRTEYAESVLQYDLGNTNMVAVANYDASNMNQGWYFTKGSTEGKVLIHPYLGGGDVLSAKSTGDAPAAVWAAVKGAEIHQEWIISAVSSANAYNIKAGDGSNYFSNNGGYTNKMGFWSGSPSTDGGSLFLFTRVDFAGGLWENTLNAYLSACCAKESYAEGNTLGYYQGGAAYDEARPAAVAALADEQATESDLKERYTALRSAKEAIVLLTPEAGKFYRIKSAVSNNYVTAPANTGVVMTMNATASERNIFYKDEDGHLLVYGSGYFLNGKNHANLGNKATYAFEASKTGADGTFAIKPSSTNYWYDNTTSLDVYQGGNHTNCNWTVEEVTSLPVTIGSIGYATLYAPVALAIPEGVSAYVGTLDEAETVLTLTEVEEVIPARTGVVLYRAEGNASTTHYFDIAADTEALENDFVGNKETVAKSGNPYTLQTHDADGDGNKESVAFKKYTGNTLTGFKAYLNLNEAQTAPVRIRFAGEDATEIENSKLKIENSIVYDLIGRRVVNPGKGVYIVNGKKVIK